MVVEKLPLLDSNYDEWDWKYNTCSYWSQDVYDAYYMALIKEDGYGYCRNFACDVWNRIRYGLIGGIYSETGLEEDLSFVPDGAVTMKFGEEDNEQFTAWRFNDAIVNVDPLNIFHFNWERTNNMPGFLGRRYVRGFADYGEQSDYVYAWYILELVEKANKLIRILKNEYTFSELNKEAMTVMTYLKTDAVAAPSAIFDHKEAVKTITASTMAKAGASALNTQLAGFSYHNGIIVPRLPQPMTATAKGNSFVSVMPEKLKAEAIKSAAKASTMSGSVLKGVPFVGRLKYIAQSMTQTRASLDISNIRIVDTVQQAKSELLAKIVASSVWLMETKVHGNSYTSPDLRTLESLRLETMYHSDSYSLPEISLIDRVLLPGITMANSLQKSTLQYLVPRYMKKDIMALSYPQARAKALMGVPLMSDVLLESYTESNLNACPVVQIVWTEKSNALIDATIRAVQMIKMEASEFGISAAGGSKIIPCENVRMEAQSKSQSASQGMLQKGIPVIVEASEQAQTKTSGNLSKAPKKALRATETAQGKYDAEVVAASAKGLNIVCVAGTMTCCTLELEYNSKDAWKDPVRNGNDLYIRTVYPQWQENSNVHLDNSGVFYEPVQTDGDVYIRSNESMKEVIENG